MRTAGNVEHVPDCLLFRLMQCKTGRWAAGLRAGGGWQRVAGGGAEERDGGARIEESGEVRQDGRK